MGWDKDEKDGLSVCGTLVLCDSPRGSRFAMTLKRDLWFAVDDHLLLGAAAALQFQVPDQRSHVVVFACDIQTFQ
jgi:hypothetical protein